MKDSDQMAAQRRLRDELCRILVQDAGEFAIPNLDDLSNDEEDVDAMAHVFTALASYCLGKAQAMRHRKAGRIHEALAMERTCEQRYAALPTSLQW